MRKMAIAKSTEWYNDFIDVPTLVDEILHCRSDKPVDKLAAMLHNYICNASAESNGSLMDNEDVITCIDDALSGMDMNLDDENIQINHNVVDINGTAWIQISIVSYGEEVLSAQYNVLMARAMYRKRKLQLAQMKQKQEAK